MLFIIRCRGAWEDGRCTGGGSTLIRTVKESCFSIIFGFAGWTSKGAVPVAPVVAPQMDIWGSFR